MTYFRKQINLLQKATGLNLLLDLEASLGLEDFLNGI